MAEFLYGILTVSDRCHRGESVDESGPKIKHLLQQEYNASHIEQKIVPDEEFEIEKILLHFCDDLKLNCVITTGGTGCAPRDVTPEATRKVIQKEFPQLSTVMLLEGLRKTEFAALSRGTCGIRKRTLIINFPGSVKAVTESFNAIKKLIPHAIELICDMKKTTEAMHKNLNIFGEPKTPENDKYRSIKEKSKELSTDDKISDDVTKILKTPEIKEIFIDSKFENLLENNLSNMNFQLNSSLQSFSSENSILSPSTSRHVCPHKTAKPGDINDRNSPYPMVEVSDALKSIFNNIKRISNPRTFKSPMNCPPFRASIKDGYAVKTSSSSKIRKVIGSISAGDRIIREDFKDNECYKINTGAAIPDFADAIVQVEDTKLIESNEDGSELKIELSRMPTKNLDVREIGSDLLLNETLFTTNGLMDVAEKTLLASVGLSTIELKPKIAIISTGDELQDPSSGDLEEGHIYDSNTTMLKLLCKKYNFDLKFTKIARDNYESVKRTIELAMKECCFIISSGGVSMGDKDFIKKVLIDLGFTIHFGRVNVKPGKPMTFATLNEKSFFGLPGNPVSAFVTFHIFVLPALRFTCGFSEAKSTLSFINVILEDTKYELDERPEYVRARIIYNQSNSQFSALITSNQISSRIASLINADALLQLPSRSEWKTPYLAKGTKLKAFIINQFFISSLNDKF